MWSACLFYRYIRDNILYRNSWKYGKKKGKASFIEEISYWNNRNMKMLEVFDEIKRYGMYDFMVDWDKIKLE